MAKKLALDRVLFIAVLVLVTYGAIMVYSSSAILSMDQFNNSYSYILKHLLILVFGLALMAFVSEIDYRRLKSIQIIAPAMLVSLLLLIVVLFLNPVNNTYRWIRFGMFSFQPSELAKLVLIIFTASYISNRFGRIRKGFRHLVPMLLIISLYVTLIVIEPDFGTGVVVIFVLLAMLFVSGAKFKYYFFGGVAASGLMYYMISNSSYRMSRMLAFSNPWADPLGYGFQSIQSMIAIGSGGVFGLGLTKGTQKYFYLPAPHTDFIYSVMGEELGFVGCMILLITFLVVLWRGLRIAIKAPDRFGTYMALGITIMIVGQAFLNMSVALTLLPTKGIPLPLVSFGGTSLLIMLLSVGVLLNISRYTT